MADGEMTIKLDPDVTRRLQAAARASGVDANAYAGRLIEQGLPAEEPDHWAIARERAAEYDRTGKTISVDEFFDKLQARVDELQAKRG